MQTTEARAPPTGLCPFLAWISRGKTVERETLFLSVLCVSGHAGMRQSVTGFLRGEEADLTLELCRPGILQNCLS